MGRSLIGQLITLAVQVDYDPPSGEKITKYKMINVRKNDTCQSIASRLGQPGHATAYAKLNGVRSSMQKLNRARIRVPSQDSSEHALNVLAGAEPPKITGGFAKFSTVDRYSRTGITQFTGYDPLTLVIPIVFEAYSSMIGEARPVPGEGPLPVAAPQAVMVAEDAAQLKAGEYIEQQIELLERMAGRGFTPGGGIGPPPVIRATTTDGNGNPVGLIPRSYQWTKASAGPLWRLAGLTWEDGALRNDRGNRIRAMATLTLQEHTHSSLVSQSAAARAGVP